MEINLPEEILLRLKSKSQQLGFNKIEEYCQFLLTQSTISEESEKEKIAKKLEQLGYL